VLVRQVRGEIVESEHRGHIVEVDATGSIVRVLGDPERPVTLRSTVKPFGLLALVEAGGIDAFDLAPTELALMASSHSGEDLHVRTLQGVYRRAGLSQTLLACGSENAPLDTLTAARLARDGEKPGPVRHNCSGQHSSFILLSRMKGWPPETYWQPDHPAQVAYRSAVARAFGTRPDRLVTAIDACGIETFAFPLREVARAYALLADPASVPAADSRASLAGALLKVRDAMLANPEMVAGSRDRLDTSLMKAAPGGLISKGGAEGLRGIAVLPGPRPNGVTAGPSGLAMKIEDGDGAGRAGWAAAVEALRQAGVIEGQAVRMLSRYHRPSSTDSHGRLAAETVASFELAPVGELFA
jgi:L-asparaginase II